MEKNKSIDGLVSRRSKKAASSPKKATAKKVTTTKKTTTTKKPAQPKKLKAQSIDLVNQPEHIQPTEESSAPDASGNFLEPIKAFDFDPETGDLKVAEDSPEKDPETTSEELKKEPKVKKKTGKVRKTITIVALLIVLLLIGGVIWLVLWGNDIIAKITGGQGNVFDLIFTSETYEPLRTDENGRTNILAFGTSGYNMEGDEGNGIHDGAALTDSIMAISLDQETGDIAMISLPRDLKASPTCTATGKINEVYWCNNMYDENEQAGAEALMAEVTDILGIDFQYYAHINWGSLVQIVDILGGITVTLDEDIDDYGWTDAYYEAGVPYTLNGEEALGLARARHGTTSGDFSRGASQQKILIGIKDKLLEKNLSITDIINLASSLGDNLRTNFSIDEFKTLAHLSQDLDFNSMRQISLSDYFTTGMINEISYVLPRAGVGNYNDIHEHVAIMMSNDPRIYEEPTILVLNGTEEVGLATSEKAALETEGYPYVYADNAPEGEYPEKYSLYEINSKPGTKELLESYYNTAAKSSAELPANIPADYDFIIILGGINNNND